MAVRLLVDVALARPDRICVYVSDTWDNAVKAAWVDQVDGIPAVLASLGLRERRRPSDADWDYHVNLSTRAVTFRNGSIVELAGADRGAWAKFRGRKLDLIVADEMQRQVQEDLERAVASDVRDCLTARRGRFVGLGTVGRALRGLWYDVVGSSAGRVGWTRHTWTAEHLAHVTDVWANQLADAAAFGIDVDADPTFLRERRAVWVRDEESLLHRVTDACLWDGVLPPTVRVRCPEHGHLRGRCVCDLPHVPRTQPLQVFAGLDLGAGDGSPDGGDPCAVVVGGISSEEWILRELHSEQRFCPTTDVLVDWLRGLVARLGIRRFYVDPAWRMTANDLARLHGLPVEPAVKGDAEGTTEDLWHMERAAALAQGTALIRRGSVLHGQLETVLRDPRELERGHVRTSPGQDDHALDSWRYLFRMVRTRHARAPEPPMTDMQRREAELRADKERRARQAQQAAVRGPFRR